MLTDPAADRLDGLVPFWIDWGSTPHPASAAPRAGELLALRGVHPEPERVRAVLAGLGLELRVERGDAPALFATIRTARGEIELS